MRGAEDRNDANILALGKNVGECRIGGGWCVQINVSFAALGGGVENMGFHDSLSV